MKIIGQSDEGFIVDMSKSELEMLTGFYYGNSKFRLGQKINIEGLYRQLKSLTSQDKEIKRVVHTLKTAAGMLEKIDPVFYEETT